MSGRRPLSRVSLELCEHLGCGHVFGLFARGKDPLALMLRPLGSLPQSPYRVRSDADSLSGFRALSVGSHHPVVTLDCVSPRGDIPRQASCKPLASLLAASADGRPLVVFAALREQ